MSHKSRLGHCTSGITLFLPTDPCTFCETISALAMSSAYTLRLQKRLQRRQKSCKTAQLRIRLTGITHEEETIHISISIYRIVQVLRLFRPIVVYLIEIVTELWLVRISPDLKFF